MDRPTVQTFSHPHANNLDSGLGAKALNSVSVLNLHDKMDVDYRGVLFACRLLSFVPMNAIAVLTPERVA
jgi:hypothetical protein